MALPAALAARPISATARKIVDSEHYSTTSDGGWTRTIWSADGKILGTLHKQSRRIGHAAGWVTSLSRRDSRFYGTLAEAAADLSVKYAAEQAATVSTVMDSLQHFAEIEAAEEAAPAPVTAEQVRPFLNTVATVEVVSRTATGDAFEVTLTGVVATTFPDEIEQFGFSVMTGPNEGLGMSLAEVKSITAAEPAAAARLLARLALAERHAAEAAALEARHEAEIALLDYPATPGQAKVAWIATADFSRPAADLIDALTEVLQDAGLPYEKAVVQADRAVMARLF